ncbi:c-type cytochrome [Roseiconus lacunae]|uniref:c-type cytochrome n=1 Tax=Roseiconus lacunae TaxID=2605694 RepID=UPI0013583129|nr:c-type cytochrome [Roseiconus lacunae]
MTCRFSYVLLACLLLPSLLLPGLLFAAENTDDDAAQARRDAVLVRAIERMQDFNYREHPEVIAAIDRQLHRTQGTPEFIRLVKKFQPAGIEKQLIETLVGDNRSAAVEAAVLLLEMEHGRPLVRQRLIDKAHGPVVAEVLGLLGNGRAIYFLSEITRQAEQPFDLRRAAVVGLARSKGGQKKLIEQADQKQLVGDTWLIAGALLARSDDESLRKAAGRVLPQPAQKDAKPLPPVDQLAKAKGDAVAGMKLFRGVATCANCHIVNGHGKDVGPNLSEIGSKLSREAMLTAILLPSAGISHNYENYVVLTAEGQVIAGLKMSETDREVVIRTADAIDRKIEVDDIESMKKSEKSVMPENLHHLFGQQGLVDLVEYMATLKKADPS